MDSLDVILSDEHIEFKWVNFKEAFETLVWNGQKKGIQTVYNMVSNNDERIRWTTIEINKEN